MRRRQFIGSGLASLAASTLGARPLSAAATSQVRPSMPGWPSESEWEALNQATHRRLSRVMVPDLAAADAKKLLANPFFRGDQPGLTQSSGWLGSHADA